MKIIWGFLLCVLCFTVVFAAEPGDGDTRIVFDKEYYDSGELKSITPRKDGKINGTATTYFRSGLVSSVCEYVDGMVNGRHDIYDEYGDVKLSWVSRNNSVVSESMNGIYAESGRRNAYSTTFTVTRYKNGQHDGNEYVYYIEFNEEGNPTHFEISKSHLAQVIPYVNGVKHGVVKGYRGVRKDADEKGWLTGTEEWNNGVRHGPTNIYDENGNIKLEEIFVCGLQHGLEKEFYPNGKVQREVPYKLGKKHGSENFYNEQGEKLKTIEWDMGVEVKQIEVIKEAVKPVDVLKEDSSQKK